MKKKTVQGNLKIRITIRSSDKLNMQEKKIRLLLILFLLQQQQRKYVFKYAKKSHKNRQIIHVFQKIQVYWLRETERKGKKYVINRWTKDNNNNNKIR